MDKIPTDELVKIVERWVKMGMLQNKNTVAHAERVIIVNRLVDWMSGLLVKVETLPMNYENEPRS